SSHWSRRCMPSLRADTAMRWTPAHATATSEGFFTVVLTAARFCVPSEYCYTEWSFLAPPANSRGTHHQVGKRGERQTPDEETTPPDRSPGASMTWSIGDSNS